MWIASLDDGQRISSKDLLKKSNANPWRQLLSYLETTKNVDGSYKKITSVEIVVNGISYHSPSIGKSSIFRSKGNVDKFWIFYKSARHLKTEKIDSYIGLSYRSGDYRNIFWINEENNNSYTQVVNVVNPSHKNDFGFVEIEKDIEESYGWSC